MTPDFVGRVSYLPYLAASVHAIKLTPRCGDWGGNTAIFLPCSLNFLLLGSPDLKAANQPYLQDKRAEVALARRGP